LLLIFTGLVGCGHYENIKSVTTVTEKANGEKVTVFNKCTTSIVNWRDTASAGVNIGADSTVQGQAADMRANEEALKVLGNLVGKIT